MHRLPVVGATTATAKHAGVSVDGYASVEEDPESDGQADSVEKMSIAATGPPVFAAPGRAYGGSTGQRFREGTLSQQSGAADDDGDEDADMTDNSGEGSLWRAVKNAAVRSEIFIDSEIIQVAPAGSLLEQIGSIRKLEEGDPENPHLARRVHVCRVAEHPVEVLVDRIARKRIHNALDPMHTLMYDVTVGDTTLGRGETLLLEEGGQDGVGGRWEPDVATTMVVASVRELRGWVTLDFCKFHERVLIPFLEFAGARLAGNPAGLEGNVAVKKSFFERSLCPFLHQPLWQSDREDICDCSLCVDGQWDCGALRVSTTGGVMPDRCIRAVWGHKQRVVLETPGEEMMRLSRVIQRRGEQVVSWGHIGKTSETWWSVDESGEGDFDDSASEPSSHQGDAVGQGPSKIKNPACDRYSEGQAAEFLSPVFRRWVPAVVGEELNGLYELDLGPLGCQEGASPSCLRRCLTLRAYPASECIHSTSVEARLHHRFEVLKRHALDDEDYDMAKLLKARISDVGDNGVPCVLPASVLDRYAQAPSGEYDATDCMWEVVFMAAHLVVRLWLWDSELNILCNKDQDDSVYVAPWVLDRLEVGAGDPLGVFCVLGFARGEHVEVLGRGRFESARVEGWSVTEHVFLLKGGGRASAAQLRKLVPCCADT